MAERRVFIDIQAKSNPSRGGDRKPEVRAESGTRTDNTFKFNFVVAEDQVATTSLPETTPPSVELSRLTVCKEEGSDKFAFNFQIPAVTPGPMGPEAPPAPSGGSEPSPPGPQKPAPHTTLEACVPTESMAQSKPKKKKKSGKKKTTESSKPQETTSSLAGSHGDKESVLTAEQQLQRELDWVMEQLRRSLETQEVTQKVTPKQREDASRALKILRSAKAPLAKKRQVMRATTGDYRRRMEEERQKQLKLIQSAMTSLQVRAVPDPKKSVFHRRAGTKPGAPGAGEPNAPPALTSDPLLSGNETSHFVFTSSKEEFKFNFV
ncbi:unnamed protein product [Arctogadus glacialis]